MGTARCRGDEAELYRRHHLQLIRVVRRAVDAPDELVEDACQSAWTIFLRRQPERGTALAWLTTVAIREAWRLSRIGRRHLRFADLTTEAGVDNTKPRCSTLPAAASVDTAIEARRALEVLAGLPDRQRRDLALLIAGFSYREIASTDGQQRSYTYVNKQLVKARARIRQLENEAV